MMKKDHKKGEKCKDGENGTKGSDSAPGSPKEVHVNKFMTDPSVEGIEALLKKGKFDINEKKFAGNQTILHVACYAGNFDLVYFLLLHGADVHVQDSQGWTPLHCAAANLHLRVCSLLLSRRANPNAVNSQQTRPLHYIIRSHYTEELIQVLNLLIEKGADLECRNKNGETPLMHAAAKGTTESVRYLIDFGADVNAVDRINSTALHRAVENGNIDTVLLLLKSNVKHDIKATNGTALQIAIREKKDEIARLLQNPDLEISTYTDFQGSSKDVFIRDSVTMFVDKHEDAFQLQNSGFILGEMESKSNENLLEKKTTIHDDPWYFGNISRVDAESILFSYQRNVLLVRTCSVPGSYAISQYDKKNDRFHHILVTPVSSGGYTLEDCNDTQLYPTLGDLLSKSPETSQYEPVVNPRRSFVSRDVSTSIKQNSMETIEGLPPIIQPIDGFSVEIPRKDFCKDRDLAFPACNYQNWFYHSKAHYNFAGRINRKKNPDKFEPIVVSILPEPNRYRIIIWTRLGDRQYFYPAEYGAKKIKWKQGLPINMKNFIAEKINQHRGKDGFPLKIDLEYAKTLSPEKLLEFENYDPLRAKCFNVGVVYAKEGQKSEEEIFGNEHGSPNFNQFLLWLGDKIPLLGWKGYKGDLDIKTDSTGKFSIFRRWKGFEIMFHVSTLLPYSPDNSQQIPRKRRIGNDVGTIIYQEGGAFTTPIVSQFLHAYYVVSPNTNCSEYRFSSCVVNGVQPFGPEIPAKCFRLDGDFRDFLLTKVLNGLLASMNHPALREKLWCRPKESFLKDLVKVNSKTKLIVNSLTDD